MINIVIFGAPGAGKGTQSAFIENKYNLTHLSTGDMLRAEIKAGTPVGIKAKTLIDAGQLVPDSVVLEMIENKVKEGRNSSGFIFDGFPRTIAQAEALDRLLASIGEKVDFMFNLIVEHNELISRLLERGRMLGRDDDNLETITKRLDVYHKTTEPLIAYYADAGVLHTISNDSTVEECSAKIAAWID